MINTAILMGRLTQDPELKTTPSGTSVTSFQIAVDRSYTKHGEERKADFITIVAWKGTAEFICKYFTKGQMMAVTGSIQTRNYEDRQGNRRTAFEVAAREVSFCGGKEGPPPKRGGPERAQANIDIAPDEEYEEILLDDGRLPF